jgi:type II secretory pathway component GspD/PulD (secretin)
MHAFLRRSLLILLLLPVLGLADDTRIQVIELQGRSAQEMIPLIQPLLDEGDAITGTGYQLILRTRPENLARIETVVKRLDQAPKRLRISVHRGELDTREQYRHDVQLERESDGIRLDAGEARNGGGLVVEQRDRAGSAGVRMESTRRVRDADQRQQVQALEGQAAYIATGVAFPYVSQVERYGSRGTGTSIEYREANTGFYVLARLRGDGQVQLDISPHKEELSPRGGGMVETSALVTSVSGPINTWLELGGIGETRNQDTQGYTRIRRTRDHQEEQLWFRVEVLD